MSNADPFMTAPAEPSEVATDVPCRKCQYNLRGLSTDSRCPECGSPVGFSLRGDMMRYSDPAWVETLQRGVGLILWAIVVAIFAAAINAALGRGVATVPGMLGTLASAVLQVVGAWMLTTPDPSGLGEDRYGTSRKIIRFTLLIGLMQQLFTFITRTMNLPPAMQLLITILTSIFALISLVGTFATLKYLSSLARRIPSDSLANRATTLMWGLSISLGFLIVISLMLVLVAKGAARGSGAPVSLVAFGCAAGIGGIALIVFGIMYLLMLVKFSSELKAQAAYARSTWAATPANPPGRI